MVEWLWWKMPNFDQWCLAILVLQGFAVTWYEYRVYAMHADRFEERKQWREQKRKSQLKAKEKSEDSPPTP